MKRDFHRMTKRVWQVAGFIALGFLNKQIADTLGISIKTVEKHRDKLMKLYALGNTADITRFAIVEGIIVRSKSSRDYHRSFWRAWCAENKAS